MNNIEYIVAVTLAKVWEILTDQSVLKVHVLKTRKMGKRKDLSNFEKGQIAIARSLGESISKTASPVGHSWDALVSTYHMWAKEGQLTNQQHGYRCPRPTDVCGPLPHLQ